MKITYKNILFKSIVAFALLALSSCLSISTLQSGKSLGENNMELTAAGTFGEYSQNSYLDKEGSFDMKPLFSFRGRIGISENIDFGLQFDQTSLISTSFKYQFLGNKNSTFASSIGTDAGFNFLASTFGNFTHFVSIPIYTSYHMSDNFIIYLTPRYMYISKYVFSDPDGDSTGSMGRNNMIRSSYGIIFGKKNKIGLEVSNYDSKFYKPTQFTLGYIYTFNW